MSIFDPSFLDLDFDLLFLDAHFAQCDPLYSVQYVYVCFFTFVDFDFDFDLCLVDSSEEEEEEEEEEEHDDSESESEDDSLTWLFFELEHSDLGADTHVVG